MEWREAGLILGLLRAADVESSGLADDTKAFFANRMRGALFIPIASIHAIFIQLGEMLITQTIAQLTSDTTWADVTQTFAEAIPSTLPPDSPTFSPQVSSPCPLPPSILASSSHFHLAGLRIHRQGHPQVVPQDLHEGSLASFANIPTCT